MGRRPALLLVAVVMLVLIGASGLLVGLELAGSLATSSTVEPAMIAITGAIAAYGVVAAVSGVGLYLRRRLAHRVAVATILVGLAELVWQSGLLGFDPITTFGIIIWTLVLALLASPPVRSALARG